METEKELNKKIMEITSEIYQKYPELHKYLVEMTDTLPDEKDPEVTRKKLYDYCISLNQIVKKYKEENKIKEDTKLAEHEHKD